MKRFLSVWLPRWPIERRRHLMSNRPATGQVGANGQPPREAAPLVLSSMSQNGPRITALNAAAERLGLHPGMALADARAIHPALLVEHADEEGDETALTLLALWCQCFSPLTRPDPADGIMLDITGCAHLFGGEAGLIAALASRLSRFGLTARLAIAPTIGAAWALARFGHTTGKRQDKSAQIAEAPLHEALAPLPVAALRLDERTVAALSRLGLKRIGDLLGKPRAPLVARFGPVLAERLDQALGRAGESLGALGLPPVWRAEKRFPEPLITLEAIEAMVDLLAADLAHLLDRDGKGARRLQLAFYRVDGWCERLEVRVSAPTREARHMKRLLCERLDAIVDHAGFGFEAMTLGAFDVENIIARQNRLPAGAQDGNRDGGREGSNEDLAPLIDRLVNRLGPDHVTRFAPYRSHLPERTARSVPVLQEAAQLARSPENWPDLEWKEHLRMLADGAACARPLLLLERPEPVRALFTVPDGPPVRFEWRRVAHRVARADGPERIAPEWWRVSPEGRTNRAGRLTRDYYRVEDEAGRRFWLYREGLFERASKHPGDDPAWFIHGIFA